MKRTVGLMVLSVFLIAASSVWASPIYYTMNIAGSSAEYAGYDYYGGDEYMKYRDLSDLSSEHQGFATGVSTLAYRGCDVAMVNGVETMFYARGYNGGWQYINKREWDGSAWGAAETVFYRTNKTIRSVAVGQFGSNGGYEMYYTVDSQRDGSQSTVYKRTLDNATGVWGAETEVAALRSDNGNRSYMGIAVGDIDADGNLDLFLSRWLGPTHKYPDIVQYTLDDGEWTYSQKVLSKASVLNVFSDLTIGDTDEDGNLELVYSEKMGGPNYNYINSMEWNGSWFDSSVNLFMDTNGWHDYDGVAMLVPEPMTIGLLIVGGLSLLRRNRKMIHIA